MCDLFETYKYQFLILNVNDEGEQLLNIVVKEDIKFDLIAKNLKMFRRLVVDNGHKC